MKNSEKENLTEINTFEGYDNNGNPVFSSKKIKVDEQQAE